MNLESLSHRFFQLSRKFFLFFMAGIRNTYASDVLKTKKGSGSAYSQICIVNEDFRLAALSQGRYDFPYERVS